MKKYINIILLLVWMIFIFIMSHSSAIDSSNQSGLITNFLSNILNIYNTEILEIIIRKSAHLFEYIVLGILSINCLKDYKTNKYVFISIIFCIVYACTDELHQLFIPGRSGNIVDIIIDTLGSIIGITLYNFIYKKLKYKYCKNNI